MVAILNSGITPFNEYAEKVMKLRYSHVVSGRKEDWWEIAHRVAYKIMLPILDKVGLPLGLAGNVYKVIRDRKFIPGGRILAQAGREYHQTDNCFTLRAEDSREGWADLAHKCTMMFMSGGGVGVDYSGIREYGSLLRRSGGIASGPIPLIEMVNSIAAAVRQGGERRGACYGMLNWSHADIDGFVKMKEKDGVLNHTNISVGFDREFYNRLNNEHGHANSFFAESVLLNTLKHAVEFGDPGFQFDNDEQTLRNACTEIISNDDSDSCCIGSVNFAAIESLMELADVTNLGILFLLCNTMYTDFPTEEVRKVKEKNRRLGLGIMGLGEWFIQREQPYGYFHVNSVLDMHIAASDYIGNWLKTWKYTCDSAAIHWSNKLSVNKPVATRAIAPTGTISIVGGRTSPGMEPLFHTAYRRTYNTNKTQEFVNGYAQDVVIEPVALKLYEQGYDVGHIDTAWGLSQDIEGIERRIEFQAYLQQFVDNGISSTINLPKFDPDNNLAEKIAPVLVKYLPQLRGITFYPDGAKDYQPVVPVEFNEAIARCNNIEEYPMCKGGECGS